ncbi:MAG: hypothetical protein H0V06_01285 [Gemmatimonadetes bacterium]|nr:hypothetical protein [Gemmatimonadota bacterium]
MNHCFNRARRWHRAATLGVVLAASGVLAGCDGLLEVENPQAIAPEQLDDRVNLNLLTNGVVGDFQRAFDDLAYFSGVFTDELRNHFTFVEEPQIDQRDVTPGNGTAAGLVYNQLQRARGLADSTAVRLQRVLGDSANSDLRLARVLAYGGMTYVLMAETLCEAPVNLSRPYTPEELFRDFALPRFQQAIQVATAAQAAAAAQAPATAGSRRTVAGADSIINFARVGAARAALNLGNKQQAVQFASPVPTGFLLNANYSDNSSEENNFVFARLTNTVSASVAGTPFEGLKDIRVPIPASAGATGTGFSRFQPNSPTAYSTYTGTLPGGEFTRGSNIRVASGLEAQYIVAEAEGLNAKNLAFINARRAIGGEPALPATITPARFLAAVREQRRIDLYLDAHRLGDLRRYRAQFGDNIEDINKFEQGPYLESTTVSFANQYCFPVSASEMAGNPNYPRG